MPSMRLGWGVGPSCNSVSSQSDRHTQLHTPSLLGSSTLPSCSMLLSLMALPLSRSCEYPGSEGSSMFSISSTLLRTRSGVSARYAAAMLWGE